MPQIYSATDIALGVLAPPRIIVTPKGCTSIFLINQSNLEIVLSTQQGAVPIPPYVSATVPIQPNEQIQISALSTVIALSANFITPLVDAQFGFQQNPEFVIRGLPSARATVIEGISATNPTQTLQAQVIWVGAQAPIFNQSQGALVVTNVGNDGLIPPQTYDRNLSHGSGLNGSYDEETDTATQIHVPPTLLVANAAISFALPVPPQSRLMNARTINMGQALSALTIWSAAALAARVAIYLTNASDAGAATPGAVSPVVEWLIDKIASTSDTLQGVKPISQSYAATAFTVTTNHPLMPGFINIWSAGTPTLSARIVVSAISF